MLLKSKLHFSALLRKPHLTFSPVETTRVGLSQVPSTAFGLSVMADSVILAWTLA